MRLRPGSLQYSTMLLAFGLEVFCPSVLGFCAVLNKSCSLWKQAVCLHAVASQDGSYSGSGSAVLSSGSTSSLYAMVSPDAVISQQHQVIYTCTRAPVLVCLCGDVTVTSSTCRHVLDFQETFENVLFTVTHGYQTCTLCCILNLFIFRSPVM